MANSNIIGVNGNVLFNTVGHPFVCVPSTGTVPITVISGHGYNTLWQTNTCGSWIYDGTVPLTTKITDNLKDYRGTASVAYYANSWCCGGCVMSKTGAITVDASEYAAISISGNLVVAANTTSAVSAYRYSIAGGTVIGGTLTGAVTAALNTSRATIPVSAVFSGYTGPLTVSVTAYAYKNSKSDYSGTFNFVDQTFNVTISAKS